MMPSDNGTQTISNEKQVAVVDQNANPLQSNSKPDKPSKIHGKRILVISAVIVLVIAGGCLVWNVFQYEDTDDAQVDGHVMPLSPRVNGHIKAVYVDEGQLVHAGEAMMTIDAQDYKIAEELAQVNLSEAQFTAASSRHNDNVHLANAEVARRELQLAQAELNLSYTIICSPVTGIVGKRRVEVGQNVNIGQELVDVLPLDDVWVTANFKETQLAGVHPGQDVDLVIDAVPSVTFHGKVDSFQAGTGTAFSVLPAENATGNYVKIVQRVPVKLVIDDLPTDVSLGPGMSVDPTVRVDPKASFFEQMRARL
jgi:multidrug resistance efflux pump